MMPLIIGKTQIKIVRYSHLIDWQKLEKSGIRCRILSYTADEMSTSITTFGNKLTKLDLYIPYDSAILLLDSRISSNVHKMIYTNMFCIYNNNKSWYIHIIHYK